MNARQRRASRAFLLALYLLGAPGTGRASITDPVLAVASVTTETGATTRLLKLDSILPSEDVIQIPFPVQVLLQAAPPSTEYVRYDLAGGVFTGTAAELADGLQSGEVLGLLAQGSASPDGDVISLLEDRIEVLVPAAFPAGPAQVMLFVIHRGFPILSNTAPVTIGGIAP